jgi:hypothetical protein
MATPPQTTAQHVDDETKQLRIDIDFKQQECASILEDLEALRTELEERPDDEHILATIQEFEEQRIAIEELLLDWADQLQSRLATPLPAAEVAAAPVSSLTAPMLLTKPGKSGLKSTVCSDEYPLYTHMAKIIHKIDSHTKERLCCFECAQSYEVVHLDVPKLLDELQPPLPQVLHPSYLNLSFLNMELSEF